MALLQKRYVKREYEVETMEYTTEVPFNKPLSICEHTLTANDTITPYNPTGLRDFKEPIPGYGAIYRLTAGGFTPTFTGFSKSASSETWSAGATDINLVSFFFDGVAFWYTITLVG